MKSEKKNIYQKLMWTTATNLIEFQRVYRADHIQRWSFYCCCISQKKNKETEAFVIGFSRFARNLADFVLLLQFFFFSWNVIHIWSQLDWLSVNNYRARNKWTL